MIKRTKILKSYYFIAIDCRKNLVCVEILAPLELTLNTLNTLNTKVG